MMIEVLTTTGLALIPIDNIALVLEHEYPAVNKGSLEIIRTTIYLKIKAVFEDNEVTSIPCKESYKDIVDSISNSYSQLN